MKGLEVAMVSNPCAYGSGSGSGELTSELRGRPPAWSLVGRGWVMTSRTARNVVAVAEIRHREGYVSDPVDRRGGQLW